MSDTTSTGGSEPGLPQSEPTPEQAQEYLAALRTMPATQLVTELLFGLLNAASAKLGRRDARLLIDLSGGMLDRARTHLAADLVTQLDQALTQLRLGQVRAEGEGVKPEPNDLADVPAPPGAASASPQPPSRATSTPASGTAPGSPDPASRLWIPGRDF